METIRRQALHDGLTGLPNQSLFADRVRRALATAQRTGGELAIGVLDLDRFKTVNDSIGHGCGDELLVEVGRRLQSSVREIDTVARMGGDEFTLLLPGRDGATAANQTAARVLAAFEAPFDVGGHVLRVSPSIGFALHPDHGGALDDLLKRADAAMYQAKAAGRNTWAIYTGMTDQAYDRLTLEADLFEAVAHQELLIAFEPIVRIADGTVVGAEALVRWDHPTLGLLGPADFIRVAEDVGLVAEIDSWVLRRACLDLGRARPEGTAPAHVAVNVSGRSVTHPAFADRVAHAIASAGIRPDQLVLEVTEAVTGDEASGVARALAPLRSRGVRVAIDDFGRGHSSLSRLDELPADQLKIDRAFLRHVDSGEAGAPVLTAIIAMAKGLGLEVLAEGVERPEQLELLRSRGCELAQGFLFGRSLLAPLAEVLEARPPHP
jgi:diguanylate cyclase (GGDEF)-like protein